MSRQVNLIEIQLECIHRRRTLRFIGKRGVTVRSVHYSLINGPDTYVTANHYDFISALRSLNGRSGFDLHDLRYKTHKKRRPSDRDPTIVMRFGAFNRGRYNSSKRGTCALFDRGSRSRDRRARSSVAQTIQRSGVCHVA